MNLRILKILRSENRGPKGLENRDSIIKKSSIVVRCEIVNIFNILKALGLRNDQILEPWSFVPKIRKENRVLERQNLSQICLFMELIE